jgi:hypothetical protein
MHHSAPGPAACDCRSGSCSLSRFCAGRARQGTRHAFFLAYRRMRSAARMVRNARRSTTKVPAIETVAVSVVTDETLQPSGRVLISHCSCRAGQICLSYAGARKGILCELGTQDQDLTSRISVPTSYRVVRIRWLDESA